LGNLNTIIADKLDVLVEENQLKSFRLLMNEGKKAM